MRGRLPDRERWLRDKPEDEFLQDIIDAARLLGYLAYHVHDSRKSEPGFPDLVLLGTGERRGRLVIFEAKTETGQPTTAQLAWLGAFMHCQGVEAHLVRPSDWDRILEILQGEVS